MKIKIVQFQITVVEDINYQTYYTTLHLKL